MEAFLHESQRVDITLKNIWRALTALGHQRLWIRPPDDRGVNMWLIVTWDGLTVAEQTNVCGNWRLTSDANAIYTNPGGIVPDGLEELTWLSVQRNSFSRF